MGNWARKRGEACWGRTPGGELGLEVRDGGPDPDEQRNRLGLDDRGSALGCPDEQRSLLPGPGKQGQPIADVQQTATDGPDISQPALPQASGPSLMRNARNR